MNHDLGRPESWSSLTRWTSARIAMGRVGASLPTRPLLDFAIDHAQARDAIHAPLDTTRLQHEFGQAGFQTSQVRSRVLDRSEYLRRPDLGRRLSPDSIGILAENDSVADRLTIVVADGLSSRAPAEHALPLLLRLRDALTDWCIDDHVILATQSRVALADEIGALRRATMVLILIGERPGLKSPDSLGAYLTYRPRVGRMDSERNCVSNIRPEGLSYDAAAFKLSRLMHRAKVLGATGVSLKDDSEEVSLVEAEHVGSLSPSDATSIE